jgi:hypothetical protein
MERADFISLDLIMPKKPGHKLLYELKEELQRELQGADPDALRQALAALKGGG